MCDLTLLLLHLAREITSRADAASFDLFFFPRRHVSFGHPLCRIGGVAVDRKVALVDANSFPGLYGDIATAGERADLTGHSHDDTEHSCVIDKPVAELLLQQVETADIILANKVDLATADELQTTLNACRALNAKATILATTFGDASLADVLPDVDALLAKLPDVSMRRGGSSEAGSSAALRSARTQAASFQTGLRRPIAPAIQSASPS